MLTKNGWAEWAGALLLFGLLLPTIGTGWTLAAVAAFYVVGERLFHRAFIKFQLVAGTASQPAELPEARTAARDEE